MTQNPYKKWQIALLKSKNLLVGKNGVLMGWWKGFMNDVSFFRLQKAASACSNHYI
jgi:hypothetical protein